MRLLKAFFAHKRKRLGAFLLWIKKDIDDGGYKRARYRIDEGYRKTLNELRNLYG